MTSSAPTSAAPAAGYSGKPLAAKLGLRAGARLFAQDAPADYAALLGPLPEGVVRSRAADATVDIAHVFAIERDGLDRTLRAMRSALRDDAVLWISWPKKASKRPTTVTEDVIRELALPLGWVDVKVCAVSEVWSGLKLVVRVGERGGRPGLPG